MSFGSHYSDEQRAAAVAAYRPREFTAKQVSAAAAAGELVGGNGVTLAPFELSPNTVRDWSRKAEIENGAAAARAAADASADAVEGVANPMLRRAAVLVDAELSDFEALRARGVEIKVSRLAHVAKLTRELADLEDKLARAAPPAPSAPAAPLGALPSATPAMPGVGALVADHRANPPTIELGHGAVAPPPVGPVVAGSAASPTTGPADAVRELASRLGMDVPASGAEPPLGHST